MLDNRHGLVFHLDAAAASGVYRQGGGTLFGLRIILYADRQEPFRAVFGHGDPLRGISYKFVFPVGTDGRDRYLLDRGGGSRENEGSGRHLERRLRFVFPLVVHDTAARQAAAITHNLFSMVCSVLGQLKIC